MSLSLMAFGSGAFRSLLCCRFQDTLVWTTESNNRLSARGPTTSWDILSDPRLDREIALVCCGGIAVTVGI